MSADHSAPSVLVLGGGGLLGSAVRLAARHGGARLGWLPRLSWDSIARFRDEIDEGFARLAQTLDPAEGTTAWHVYWCAGVGHVGASAETLLHETELLASTLDRFRLWSERLPGRGVLVFASSAGATWGAAQRFPVNEATPTAPMNRYGESKLEQEELFAGVATDCGAAALMLRISNLYGPRQNLHKRQGLISHLVVDALAHRPTQVFVPLDTSRDYIYADVAGRMALAMAAEVASSGQNGVDVRIVASEQSHPISHVVGVLTRVLKRRVAVTFGTRPEASLQPRLLSFRSRYRMQQRLANVTLEEGVDKVVRSTLLHARGE